MTKSEAKAISESCNRALRTMNGVNLLNMGLHHEKLAEITKLYDVAREEVQRVADMACAELGK